MVSDGLLAFGIWSANQSTHKCFGDRTGRHQEDVAEPIELVDVSSVATLGHCSSERSVVCRETRSTSTWPRE